jgi:hypothetical protein
MSEDLLKTKFEKLIDVYFSTHEVPTIHGSAEGNSGEEVVFTPETIKEKLLEIFDQVQSTRLSEGKKGF